ncbi:MAG: hypothetical protein ABEJ31_10635 [Haloarculaceae archaeon]
MRIPVPTNRLVALTLVGAVLTAGVAVALAAPDLLGGSNDPTQSGQDGTDQLPADAPSPNPNYTPAKQTAAPAVGEHEGEDEEYEHGEYEDD